MTKPDTPYSFALTASGQPINEEARDAEFRRRLQEAYRAKFAAMDCDDMRALLVDVAEALDSLGSTFTGDPRDFGEYRRDAWAYGIVCGWSAAVDPGFEDEGSAMDEVVRKHGWSPALRERLTRYGAAIEKLTEHPDLWPDIRPNARNGG